ncbi:MAG: alkaline phosphatase family protein [Gemmatimonadales bacterium]|nr:MAG: alkaline phosphatase family protein [Gemmatimonadales bacterium]
MRPAARLRLAAPGPALPAVLAALALFVLLAFGPRALQGGGTGDPATAAGATAAGASDAQADPEVPVLVVGITVDQLRPDYFHRYAEHLGEGGFRRLLDEGFFFRNGHFRHSTTATGPGHAAQFTGGTPSVHGLVGNGWYVRELGRSINVIEAVDSGFQAVGAREGTDGEKGPQNMLTTTFGDELFLHTGERSRTVSISRKDRGAILPGGHTGHAYWYEGGTGNFITSTFYRDELPDWLVAFNDRNLAQEYLTRVWEPLHPIETYVESRADDNPYEGRIGGSTAFPFDLARLVEEEGAGPSLLNTTPFGDELLFELAYAAIEGEELGRGPVPDVLALGLSATDAIGHRFGPASKQMQDHILRLDAYLADFLDYLDREFGQENVLVFLTSDHGAVYVPHYLRDLGVRTGHPDNETQVAGRIGQALEAWMEEEYGASFVEALAGNGLFLDHDFLRSEGLDLEAVRADVKRKLLTLDGIGGALTADALNRTEFTQPPRSAIQAAFHQKRSGDILLWLEPQTSAGTGTGGTGHGSPWTYDRHVPIVFWGFQVPAGESSEPVYVSDIASTVSIYLKSPFPSGNVGRPLNDLMGR